MVFGASRQKEDNYLSFINGIKPCIWLTETDCSDWITKLKNRKSLRKKIVKNGITYYWFFANKELKEDFINNKLHIKIKNGDLNHSKIGTLLGFPPLAVQHFSNGLDRRNIHVSYAGMYFSSYKHTLKSDIKWLLENRPIPKGKGMNIIIGEEIISVEDSEFMKKLNIEVDKFIDGEVE